MSPIRYIIDSTPGRYTLADPVEMPTIKPTDIPINGDCELTPHLQGILTAGVDDANDRKKLLHHINHCASCLAETKRLIHLNNMARKNGLKEGLKNLAVGLAAVALVGLFRGMRGIVDNQNQACADVGLKPPPWFKPIRKGPGER